MIYDEKFNFDEWAKIIWVSSMTLRMIQNWYLNEKLKYSYGELENNEAGILGRNHNRVVSKRQQTLGVKITPQEENLIHRFRKDVHYGLKNFVEILWRSIVEQKLIQSWIYKHVQVYLASDLDDIMGGIDLIVECRDDKDNEYLIGIDIAVSENVDYLVEKEWKISSYPREYIYRKQKPKKPIPRIVYALDPTTLDKSIIKIMRGFHDFQNITPEFIANAYGTKNIHILQSKISDLVKNITLH